MKGITGHTSYYVNVAQTIGIVGGLILGFKAIRLEETKAGIKHKTIREVIDEDVLRLRRWCNDNFAYRTYQHR